jgi:hypothetical protein|tara:strand:+ start:243 stop:392 length:150 start_codon:yes stop_codon:yes gene_type:complete
MIQTVSELLMLFQLAIKGLSLLENDATLSLLFFKAVGVGFVYYKSLFII